LAPLSDLITGLTPPPDGACCVPGKKETG
jgi:hypothetical protein